MCGGLVSKAPVLRTCHLPVPSIISRAFFVLDKGTVLGFIRLTLIGYLRMGLGSQRPHKGLSAEWLLEALWHCQQRDAGCSQLQKVVLSVVLRDIPGINLGTLPINLRGTGASKNLRQGLAVLHSILQYVSREVLPGERVGLRESMKRGSALPCQLSSCQSEECC